MSAHRGCRVIWLFGLPSAGKTTLARSLLAVLSKEAHQVIILDGDEMRAGMCSDLGFDDASRAENIRRASEAARLLAGQGLFVICAFITPQETHRQIVRHVLGSTAMLVHVNCPLEVCSGRDVKGLYRKAAQQQMSGLTGAQSPFEPPSDCDLVVCSDKMNAAAATGRIVEHWLGAP